MQQREEAGPSRIVQTLAIMAFAVVALFGVRQINHFVGPLLLAVNLIIAAYPIATWLRQRGLPRLVGTIAVGIVVFAILLLFFWSLGWAISALIKEVPNYQPQFEQLQQNTLAALADLGISERWISQQLDQLNPSSFMGVLQSAVSSVTNFIGLLVVTITIIFVMLIDQGSFTRRSQALSRHRPGVAQALADFTVGVRRYWIVTTVFGLIVAFVDTIFLVWYGIPLAVVWGLVAFLTNYIPNIGFVIGLIPPALMALLERGPVAAVVVIVFYSVVNFVIQSVIQPKFNGEAVGVTATVSLLSMLLWTWVLGPLGALLALPATSLVKALLIDHDSRMRWFNALIASDPQTADRDDGGNDAQDGAENEADAEDQDDAEDRDDAQRSSPAVDQ